MRKNIIILLSLLCVLLLLGGGAIALFLTEDNTEEPEAEIINILTVNATDIALVEGESENGVFSLTRKDDTFVITGKEDLPVNSTTISYITDNIAVFNAEKIIVGEEDVSSTDAQNIDYAQYGLGNDVATVNVTMKDGTSYKILIGDKTVSGSRYAMLDGDPKVYTITDTVAGYLTMTNFDIYTKYITYIVSDLTSTSSLVLSPITLTRNDGYTVKIIDSTMDESGNSADTGAVYDLVLPFEHDGNQTNIAGSNGLITELSTIIADAVVCDDITEDNLKAYGLYDPKYTLNLVSNSDVNVTVKFSEKQDGFYYAINDTVNLIYKLSSNSIAFLENDISYYCSAFPYLIDIRTIDRMTLYCNNKTYEFYLYNSDSEESEDLIVKYLSKEMSNDEFRKLYQIVIGTEQVATADKPENNEILCTAVFTKKDGTTEKIEFIKYDERRYFVSANGEGHFIVNKTQVQKILTQVENFINGKAVSGN